MRRRRLLAAASGGLATATAGCLGPLRPEVGGQPDSVPVDLANETAETVTLTVEITEESGETPVLSESTTLNPDATGQFTWEPVEQSVTYVCTASLAAGASHTETLPQGSLQGIDITVESAATITIVPAIS